MRIKKRLTLAIAAILAGGAYIFWPLDAVPDFLPLIGQVDDALVGVVTAGITLHQSLEVLKQVLHPGGQEV
ncbi:DUF1232 domain-containing protein [Candidatus Parcubacteria bacterium]|nr:DUF1232 domain-containing protein [Candidatus Parcubacteria bacterium]